MRNWKTSKAEVDPVTVPLRRGVDAPTRVASAVD
jgi:hypothetical protein